MDIVTAIGLMSGTSMDGIDIALIRSDGQNYVERGAFLFVPYSRHVRQRLAAGLNDAREMEDRAQRAGGLAMLERDITTLHVLAVEQFLRQNNIERTDVDLIGFHGQTVLHRPDNHLTVQLGDGQYLSDATGIKTVYDMRANDMTHGGQGAPLVPVYHSALAKNIEENINLGTNIAFFNIGGISNITHIGKTGDLIAFDCGPGNNLIDQWVAKTAGVDFDEGGRIALGGKIIGPLCEKYMTHPYFDLPIPKSLDRKDFEPLTDDNISLADGARSLAHVSALGIQKALQLLPDQPDIWVICGGGSLNQVIMDDLRQLAIQRVKGDIPIKVLTADEAGFSSMAMEAEAFAYLAIRSELGEVLTYPTTTGCKKPVTGGIAAMPDTARFETKRAV